MVTPIASSTTPEPLGISLRLVDGDLVFDETHALAIVSGRENLAQALTLRILTPYGSDRFNVTYGLDLAQVFAEPHGVGVMAELVRMNIVRTLGTDPRVREITRVLFDGQNAPTERIRLGRGWPVMVEVSTVADAPIVLSASVGV